MESSVIWEGRKEAVSGLWLSFLIRVGGLEGGLNPCGDPSDLEPETGGFPPSEKAGFPS